MGMLDGICVLDFTMNVAGPTAAMTMADYGATVIKVERPVGGDDARAFAPIIDGQSLTYGWLNHGKSSITVDLTDPEGIALIKKILPKVNVVIESYRPGIMERFGLDYESVCEIRPDIVYVSVSAFGQKGPYAKRPGYDLIAQAMSGVMSLTGEADGPPMKSGLTLGDMVGGINAFAAAMTALFHWKCTGVGQHVDVALVHGMIWMNTALEHGNLGRCSTRQGNHHPTLCPYGLFEGKGDQSIIIAAANKKTWESLCDVIERPDLKNDPRFEILTTRNQNQKELIPHIEAWLEQFDDISEAAALLEAAGVPCCKVYDNNDVLDEAHFRENKWIIEVPVMPGVTSIDTVVTRGSNALFSKEPGVYKPAPALGEHNHKVLEHFGIDAAEIDRLQEKWTQKK